MTDRELLKKIISDSELLEIGREAVEATLIEFRDSRLSEPRRGNGLVIREKNGDPSEVIRFGPETCLRIGLRAMLEHLEKQNNV